MPQLFIDENISLDVLNAIQTILKAFAKVKQDHNDLLNQTKCPKCGGQEYFQKRDIESSFDCSTFQESTNQRKRIKTGCENKDYFYYETSNDELNAAFHSTSIEDDVVEPTQQYKPQQLEAHKSKKFSPFTKDHCTNEQNKENQRKSSLNAIEKSPTALSTNARRNEAKGSLNENESPKWRSKVSTKSKTKRSIFNSCSTQKEATSEAKNQTSLSTRKRVSLSLGLNTPKLKQTTLNFSNTDEETYCEGVSCPIDDHLNDMDKKIFTEETHLPLSSTQFNSKTNVNSTRAVNDDSVAFVKCLNEVITIEESQPTEELFKHIFDIKEELLNQTQSEPTVLSKKAKSVAEIQKMNLNCADCEEYHRMLGRDLKKDYPKKFGVCSKHRRNNQCVETPPGFWNPKIVDSDSDHDETHCEINH